MTKNFTETATEIVLFVQNYGFSTTSIRYVEGVLNDLFNNAAVSAPTDAGHPAVVIGASAVVEGPAPVVPVVDGAGGDTVIPVDDTTTTAN